MGSHPELELLFHVPNGGQRSKAAAGKLRAEGVRAGVPDFVLPVPRGHHAALYVELKRVRGGSVTAAQKWWHGRLREAGNRVEVCRGWEAARECITGYLSS